MSDNPLNKHVPGHCPVWPTNDRLTESTRTEREVAPGRASSGYRPLQPAIAVGITHY
uniref:Uncharacterized protein n=1 Tax=mine drainage metagenome TaxID=410659 RepID=E6QH68_9ZZZZ